MEESIVFEERNKMSTPMDPPVGPLYNPQRPRNITQLSLNLLKPYKGWVVAYVLCASVSALWGIFNSLFLKIIIDSLQEITDPQAAIASIFWPAILLILNFEVHNISFRGLDYVNYHVQPLIKSKVIEKSFAYVIHHSHQFFQDNFSGKTSNNITLLATNMEIVINDTSMHLIRGLVVVIASLISMYYVNPLFAYGLSAWVLIFCSLSLYVSRNISTLSDAYAESESEVSGQIVDAISNAQNIRIFARLLSESHRLLSALQALITRFRKRKKFLMLFHLAQGLSLTGLFAFMVYTLVHLRAQNQVTLGDFALIIGLTIDVGWTLWWVTEQIDRFNDAVGKCNQSIHALFAPIEIQDAPNAKDLTVPHGRIEFDQVKFHYKGTNPLFQNKSISIEPGEKVGLVGYSGSGKSSFVNLILRLYEITDGHIRIDGQDIRQVTQDSLREHIGMIPQDPSLFHRTLWENIRYGRPDASDEEVIEASKKAHAHEFISLMPERYDSMVGERGVKLSGGQRQRIAIARAVLKNAPILILDEATSQLDSVTESLIQDSMGHLMQGKTTLVIAHRLSTLLHMDRILVFDKGKIKEDGNHKELLAKNGLYKTLWDAQVGGFLPEKREDV